MRQRAFPLLACAVSLFLAMSWFVGQQPILADDDKHEPSANESAANYDSVANKEQTANKATGEEFHKQLLEVAASYEKFGRLDERLRIAPRLCRGLKGLKPEPSQVRLSKSDDSDTHGKKLYYLYVKDQSGYANSHKKQSIGQAIVKQAWKPEDTKDERSPTVALNPEDKKRYRAGEKLGLFIMLKLAPETPNTDEGWVYATVSADGKTVTSAGCIENCMACHQSKGTKDRMFGIHEPEPSDTKKQNDATQERTEK